MKQKTKMLIRNISGITPLALFFVYLGLLIYAYASKTMNFAKTWFLKLDSLMVSGTTPLTYHIWIAAGILFVIMGIFIILFVFLTKFEKNKR
jgi:uncharacterized membrane protein YidH (DUF202 family)